MKIFTAVLTVGGALAAMGAFCVLLNVFRKKWGDSVCFDERQMAARGSAYTTAYWVLFCWIMGLMICLSAGMPKEYAVTGLYLGVLVSAVMLVTLFVLRDAYTVFLSWVDGHEKLSLGYMVLMAGVNFFEFFHAGVETMPAFSMESRPWVDLMMGMTFLYLAVLFLIRWGVRKREEAAEE